jgi:hypothetical protein
LLLGRKIERVAQKDIGIPLVTWVTGNNRVESLCETNLLHQQKNAPPNALLKLIVKAEMSKALSRFALNFRTDPPAHRHKLKADHAALELRAAIGPRL